ncbi:MAG: hypothetical protein H6960_11750 [Chromatiaceae bacterium]|nr:hypothetical protein [Chromatiaceae bacterium]
MKRIALAIAVGLAANAVNAGDLASVYQLAVQNDPNLAGRTGDARCDAGTAADCALVVAKSLDRW